MLACCKIKDILICRLYLMYLISIITEIVFFFANFCTLCFYTYRTKEYLFRHFMEDKLYIHILIFS